MVYQSGIQDDCSSLTEEILGIAVFGGFLRVCMLELEHGEREQPSQEEFHHRTRVSLTGVAELAQKVLEKDAKTPLRR